MEIREQKLNLLFDNYEDEYGPMALGYLLTDKLAEISMELTYEAVDNGSRIWPIDSSYVKGRLLVDFSPRL